MDVAAELKSALARHRAGELDAAETGYCQIVDNAEHLDNQDQKNLTEALHLLGVVILQRGQPRDAAVFIERAISRDNRNARSHNNLGNAQLALGKIEMALASYWRAAELEPTLFDAHFNRAAALLPAHRPSEAEAALKRALELQAGNSDAWCNLDLALRAQRRFSRPGRHLKKRFDCDQRLPRHTPTLARFGENSETSQAQKQHFD